MPKRLNSPGISVFFPFSKRACCRLDTKMSRALETRREAGRLAFRSSSRLDSPRNTTCSTIGMAQHTTPSPCSRSPLASGRPRPCCFSGMRKTLLLMLVACVVTASVAAPAPSRRERASATQPGEIHQSTEAATDKEDFPEDTPTSRADRPAAYPQRVPSGSEDGGQSRTSPPMESQGMAETGGPISMFGDDDFGTPEDTEASPRPNTATTTGSNSHGTSSNSSSDTHTLLSVFDRNVAVPEGVLPGSTEPPTLPVHPALPQNDVWDDLHSRESCRLRHARPKTVMTCGGRESISVLVHSCGGKCASMVDLKVFPADGPAMSERSFQDFVKKTPKTCRCCKAKDHTNVEHRVLCRNGEREIVNIRQPVSCSCSSCGA